MMNFIPEPDPMALPAPAALFKLLLILTFTLHMIFVSLALGGGLIAALAALSARRTGNPHAAAFARRFAGALPVIMAFAITFGVAPLLFVQVLYGRFFYSATVLMAWPWLSVVAALIVAYYLLYARALGKSGPAAGLLAVVLLVWVAFMYVNVTTLQLNPRKWWPIWQASQSGLAMNLDERTLLPRFLHMLVGAAGVAGIVIAAHGALAQKRAPEYGAWVKRHGAAWFALATLLQIPVGLWLVLWMPRAIGAQFLGGNVVRTAHLLGAAAIALIAALVAAAVSKSAARAPLVACAIAAAVVVAVMAIVREWVRESYLHDYLGAAQAQPQTGAILVFFALFIIGLATIAGMVLAVVRGKR